MRLWKLSYLCLPSLLLSLRLPKWFYNPPVLTNLPFLPALDIGNPCSTGGVEGVCHRKAKCAGLGLTEAGYCTRAKSVCCTEVSSCNSSLKSSVSYFASPEQPYGGGICQSEISIKSNICYLRIELEQFHFPEGRNGACGKDSFYVSSQDLSSRDIRQQICGHKEGVEILLPVRSISTVSLVTTLDRDSLARWRIKTHQVECGKSVRRSLDLAGSRTSCARRKENRRNVKSLVRKRKKQLFGKQKKRKKNRRYKRDLLSPFVGWMFGKGQQSSIKIKEENIKVETEKLKVNTFLEKNSEKVKDVPSDFFQVVTASNLDFSEFSGKQSMHNVNSGLTKNIQVSNTSEEKRRKRNYKRHKSLFHSESQISWAGMLKTSKGHTCPAYLISASHALTPGLCLSTSSTASLTVIFSVYRVGVRRVTLHPAFHLALLTLHPEIPSMVEPLCMAQDYAGMLLGSVEAPFDSQSVRDWLEEAIEL